MDNNTAFDTSNLLFEPKFLNIEYFFAKILDFFQWFLHLWAYLNSLNMLKFIFGIIALFLIFVIVYCSVRMLELRKKEGAFMSEEMERYKKKMQDKQDKIENASIRNPRWITVLDYLKSDNPSDWKLAILEADAMLEDLTDQLDLGGENIGERLKNTNKDRMKSLDDAWEAHIVRNKIAHDGSAFELTQREANRIAMLYENVFREFGFI